MARSRKLESLLTTLDQLQNEPTSPEAIAALDRILDSRYAVAVARAAKLVGKFELSQLTPALTSAFSRLMTNPVETDPNCLAKVSIAEALYRMGYSVETLFLRGIRHVQMEPVWGGKVDTAPQLRVTCAMGLVRMNYSGVFVELADLLADPESPARIGAARAIAYSGDAEQGAPLLRLRARCGDEPEVLGECLTALLQLSPQRSLDFVASFLNAPRIETQELVALALGESRLPEAFEFLQSWWEKDNSPELRNTALLAIAMLRSDPAIQFLLALIAEGTESDARDAIAALAIYQTDKALWQQVHERVEQRGMPDLLES